MALREHIPASSASTAEGRPPADIVDLAATPPPRPPLNSSLLQTQPVYLILVIVSLFGGGGFAGYSLTHTEDTERLEARITSLETRANQTEQNLADALKANQVAMKSLQDVSMLALELSVDGHRYLTDTMVDAVRLDHPDFVPRERPDRLERRLDRGTRVLDDQMYAR